MEIQGLGAGGVGGPMRGASLTPWVRFRIVPSSAGWLDTSGSPFAQQWSAPSSQLAQPTSFLVEELVRHLSCPFSSCSGPSPSSCGLEPMLDTGCGLPVPDNEMRACGTKAVTIASSAQSKTRLSFSCTRRQAVRSDKDPIAYRSLCYTP